MSRTKAVAALSGLLGMIAGAIIALPAQAVGASGTTTIDFEDGTLGGWSQNGSPTLTYVADPDNSANKVLSVAGRTSGYFGIQSPVGAFTEGVEYTVTAKVRTNGASGAAHFTYNEPDADNEYAWVGNTDTGTASEWKTVTGTFTPGANAAGAKIYFEVEGLLDYLVDDITITHECSSTPEPCVPTTTTLTSIDFEDSTTGAWSQNGSPTLGYVADPANSSNKVLSVSGRANGYDGIQSATGVFTQGVEYTISAKVRTEGTNHNAHFTFNEPDADNEYAWVGTTATGTASDWVTVTGTFIPGENAADAKIYLEVEDLASYLVDDITITYQGGCDDTDGPAPGTVLIKANFEDGTLQGWEPRNSSAGDHTVATTTTDKHGGNYAALVSDRTSQGSGIGVNVQGILEPGKQYEVSAWLKFTGTPTDRIDFTAQTGESTFTTLGQFPDVNASGWTHVTKTFTYGSGDRAFLYFETRWYSDSDGNTTPFLIDDIEIKVPDPVTIQDLTPIKSTTDGIPVGIAIDQRETSGPGAELLLKHFNQITPENYMKPEAWYNADGEWDPNAAEIDSLMNFAKANNVRVYGHVLVWHSQTPAWFFQHDDGTPLTTSEADKQLLRDRLRTHINNVADYLAQWGDYGTTNPIKAFDVVNEVVDDSSKYSDGLRRSEWYRILGEEYIEDAFTYADEAFNHGDHTADGVNRAVKLFINDYNTEQSGKRGRYLALIDRLLADDVPVDGIGHQFHVSLSMPVSALNDALTDASTRGLLQAVTEFDVTTGTPESTAKFIDQGYYYRDAFNVFRAHSDQLFSITMWGLTDGRSWRDDQGGPLVFDDDYQAKQAYYGIVEPSGEEAELPARLRTANSFQGSVDATAEGVASPEWQRLPLLPAGENAGFQTRWASDHLSVYVNVADATDDSTDAITVQVGETNYTLPRDGGALGTVVEHTGGYSAVLQVPLTAAALNGTVALDVRVTDGATTSGWNTPGVTGTVTFVEALSHVDVPEAAIAPVIDGNLDDVWSTSNSVQTLKQVSGSNGAVGTFHLLWKGQTLYVYAEVADPTVDVSGSDPWIQDSVEIYVDAANSKNGSYRYDDTQIRINADNVTSFGTGDEAYQQARLQSQTKRVAGGYVVEAAISLLEYGGLGTLQGLDVQVNDASNGARTAIRNWADPTGSGYQTSAHWGVASLVEGSLITQTFVPAVTGTAAVGYTVSATGVPSGATLTYQWLRNGSPIAGAKAATYKLAAADIGTKISVRVGSVREGYIDATKTSAQTAKVLRTFSKANAPVIVGTAKVGKKLTAKVSAWSPKVTSYTYRWYSNGVAISGATKSTFTPTRKQAGTTITVKVTGYKSGYLSVAKVSKGKKIPLLTLSTGRSKLNGPTRVGGTLTVTPGRSNVGTTKSYQWYVNNRAISGATSSTYVVRQGDQGKRITVKVTFRASGYKAKVVTLGPTYSIGARR